MTLRSITGKYDAPNVDFCAPLHRDGENCTADKQFAGFSIGDSVCNIPRGLTAPCVPLVKLLTPPCSKCTTRNDLCDARRGLSCRWGGNCLQHVCAQRASDDDVGIHKRYCTPVQIDIYRHERHAEACRPSVARVKPVPGVLYKDRDRTIR